MRAHWGSDRRNGGARARRWTQALAVLAFAASAPFAAAQTCSAPLAFDPAAGFITGNTCGENSQPIMLCRNIGTAQQSVVYSIAAEHLSGSIDVAANYNVFLAAKNANCETGDCISSEPGSPILFTPDMQGPFLLVVASNPQMEAQGACGPYTLAPDLRVIDDLVFADAFDRTAVARVSAD
jgi:hypothetical protein